MWNSATFGCTFYLVLLKEDWKQARSPKSARNFPQLKNLSIYIAVLFRSTCVKYSDVNWSRIVVVLRYGAFKTFPLQFLLSPTIHSISEWILKQFLITRSFARWCWRIFYYNLKMDVNFERSDVPLDFSTCQNCAPVRKVKIKTKIRLRKNSDTRR